MLTNMSTNDFFKKYDGQKIDYDGFYDGQCVDLYDQFCKDVINCPIYLVAGAKDIFTNYPTDYFTRVLNTPDAVPETGDVIIWGSGLGEYGHVAIFSEGDVDSFTSFDQNYPTGSKCHFQKHNYNSVLGWLHPVNLTPDQLTITIPQKTFEELVNKSSQLDEFVNNGYLNYQSVRDSIEGYQSRVTTLEGRLATAEGELKNREEQVSRLKAQLLDEQKLHEKDIQALAEINQQLDDLRQSYDSRTKELQSQVITLAKEKGALVIELEQLKATTKEKYSFKLLGFTIKVF